MLIHTRHLYFLFFWSPLKPPEILSLPSPWEPTWPSEMEPTWQCLPCQVSGQFLGLVLLPSLQGSTWQITSSSLRQVLRLWGITLGSLPISCSLIFNLFGRFLLIFINCGVSYGLVLFTYICSPQDPLMKFCGFKKPLIYWQPLTLDVQILIQAAGFLMQLPTHYLYLDHM